MKIDPQAATRTLPALFLALLIATSCSEQQTSEEDNADANEYPAMIDPVPLNRWIDVETDNYYVVEAVRGSGSQPETIVEARVKVTENDELFEVTRKEDDKLITETIRRHRWEVVKVPEKKGELGAIRPDYFGRDYQVFNRSTTNLQATEIREEQDATSCP